MSYKRKSTPTVNKSLFIVTSEQWQGKQKTGTDGRMLYTKLCLGQTKDRDLAIFVSNCHLLSNSMLQTIEALRSTQGVPLLF